MSAEGAQEGLLSYLESLLRAELQGPSSVERLSIALGAVELALTPKDESKREWPQDLPATVDCLAAAFNQFAEELAGAPALCAAPSAAAKVKAVADAVWSKLQKGSYSKDLQHAQHVYSFAAALLPGGVPGVKRQLDCAGVVTTTYALCQALSQRHAQHADLAGVCMQVSEDHCWLQLGPLASRESSVEVTTDSAAKRGLPVAADAWRGWLYTGGRAVLCTPHQALAALVTSINPAITGGKKGTDSEELQAVQKRLLEVLLAEQSAALYPAALCTLADLQEVWQQDELDAARDSGDATEVARLLQRHPGDAQDLFGRAIRLAAAAGAAPNGGNGAGGSATAGEGSAAATDGSAVPAQQQLGAANGHEAAAPADGSPSNGGDSEAVGVQWYPYSYLAAFLARRAEFLASRAAALAAPQQPEQQQGEQQEQPEQQQGPYMQQAVATYLEALVAAARGGAVLARYRFQPATDDQLFKDIEAVLEEVCRDPLQALAKAQPGGQLDQPPLLQALLQLWDGVCHLYAGKQKPQAWVALLLKLAKLFTTEARDAAAQAAAVSSAPMLRASGLWRDLQPVATLRAQFESADVGSDSGGGGGERGAKRSRRA